MQNSPDSFPVRKVCCTCKEEKDHAQFFKDGRKKDGLYLVCKPCHLAKTSRWKAENKDRVAAASRARYDRKKEELLAQGRAWALANSDRIAANRKRRYDAAPEAAIAKVRAWQEKNRDKAIAASRSSYWRNRDAALEAQRRYKAENPEILKRLYLKRQLSEKQAEPVWANQFFIAEAYHLAKLREKVCGGKWHVDHIVPLQSKLVCGLHVESNLRVIRDIENMSKGNRHWPDMP